MPSRESRGSPSPLCRTGTVAMCQDRQQTVVCNHHASNPITVPSPACHRKSALSGGIWSLSSALLPSSGVTPAARPSGSMARIAGSAASATPKDARVSRQDPRHRVRSASSDNAASTGALASNLQSGSSPEARQSRARNDRRTMSRSRSTANENATPYMASSGTVEIA